MNRIKAGILTFSDGRRYIHESLLETSVGYQRRLAEALEATGRVEPVPGREVIWNARLAQQEGRRLAAEGVEVTIFNYAIWCYPHLSAMAAQFAPGPILLFGNLHPSEPGMVGMLAAAGALDQVGRPHTRVWGDIRDPGVLAKVVSCLRAASALHRLRGQTYGVFGGRPLGMYTAVSNLDQWNAMFGLDIEHIEQYDIIRLSSEVDARKVTGARRWLESRVGEIRYDGRALTPEKLELQIRSYYAVRRIMEERFLDFVGFKSHGDLTDHFVTMDITEAFLNDPYDWDGPKETTVAATEADMDAALTMQIFKHLTGEPVLFSDVRHYEAEDKVWYLSNSGTHATWCAGRSSRPEDNLRHVTFYPECSYYPAGGASVHHFAAGGRVTLARLARRQGRYWMAIVPGEIVEFPRDKALARGATVTPEWPVAFTRLEVPPEYFLTHFPCNHIHGCYGDWVTELTHVCGILGIEARIFRPEKEQTR